MNFLLAALRDLCFVVAGWGLGVTWKNYKELRRVRRGKPREYWMDAIAPLFLLSLFAGPVLAQSELQRQIDACGQLSVCTITVPSGINVLYAPWNLRDKTALTIRGDGSSVVIWWFPKDGAPAVCMDTTGTANLVIENVTFALGNSSDVPEALWVHGRGADSRSQRGFYVSNVKFEGRGKKALVAVIALENDLWQSVGFING